MTEPDAPEALFGVRILVVDDDPDTLEVTSVVLQMSGARVTTASDAASALELARGGQFDFVVSDIAMPSHDGFWLIGQIRGLAGAAGRVPIAAFTAHASEATRHDVLAAGFVGRIAKPADPDALVAAVRSLIAAPAVVHPRLSEG